MAEKIIVMPDVRSLLRAKTRGHLNKTSLWISAFAGMMLLLLFLLTQEAAAQEIPRKILAFYDSTNVTDVFFTPLHQHAEMPLNFLGMEVVYRDVNRPLPTDAEMAGVRGIITWFSKRDQVPNPAEYCRWVDRQMQQERRFVMLGRMGFHIEGTRSMAPECRGMLQTLGLRYMGGYTDNRYFMEVVRKDPAMVEFEHHLGPADELRYIHLKPVDNRVRAHLLIRRTDTPDSESALVATTPHGGLAYDTHVNIQPESLHKVHWRINPFRFFEAAYGLQGLPRPDVTTLNGRRIFYSHIDGDGIFNVSRIDQKSYSGEIILEEILKKNSDIPVSASIITGYLDIYQYAGEREMRLYQDLFSLPNVEPAAHGYAHPLIWKKQTVALKIPKYQYSVDREVRGAVGKVRQLLQKLGIAKTVSMYQWTGDCLVPPEAIASADAAHVVNMNGGDSRFDDRYDSYSFVYPLSIVEGGFRQIYSSNSNEYTYTDLWKGRFFGYGEVVATFDNTGSPRRVQPVNVYYHYFSGEHLAALEAVKKGYDYVRAHSLMAIRASRFPRIVADFFETRIHAVPGGYHIRNNGDLRTIRFDNEHRHVDLGRSKGVLGFIHVQGSLYVTLDDGTAHIIILTSAAPDRPYIIDASFDIRGFSPQGGGLRFEKNGWMTSTMRLGGLKPNVLYTVQTGPAIGPATDVSLPLRTSAHTYIRTVRSDSRGELSVTFPNAEMGGPWREVVVTSEK